MAYSNITKTAMAESMKKLMTETVKDLLSTERSNGSISCVPVEQQPDSGGGDLWERKYVLLALDE